MKDRAASFSKASVFFQDRGIGNCAPGFICSLLKLTRMLWLWRMERAKDTSTPRSIRGLRHGRGPWPSHIIVAFCECPTLRGIQREPGSSYGVCWPERRQRVPTFYAYTTDGA